MTVASKEAEVSRGIQGMQSSGHGRRLSTKCRAESPLFWFSVIAVNPSVGAVRVEFEVWFDLNLRQFSAGKVCGA